MYICSVNTIKYPHANTLCVKCLEPGIFQSLMHQKAFVELDETTTKYCTFNISFGRYCLLRLTFGIIFSFEIFHRAIEQIIEGLQGAKFYVDIVWGSSVEEHNERPTKVLKRRQKYGLNLNKENFQFGMNEILFLGNKLSGEGIEPGEEKVNKYASTNR